jgi:hypothetical protein
VYIKKYFPIFLKNNSAVFITEEISSILFSLNGLYKAAKTTPDTPPSKRFI